MRWKRKAAALTAGMMAFSMLAGCGAEEAKETAAVSAEESSVNTGQAQEENGNGEKTVINIWSKDRHDAAYVQEKIDEYNASNTDNIEV